MQTNVDKTRIYNPTTTDVWVLQAGESHCIEGGQALRLRLIVMTFVKTTKNRSLELLMYLYGA